LPGVVAMFSPTVNASVSVIERRLENEIEFAQSDIVREEANKAYGAPIKVTVTPSDSSDLLTITASDRVAETAAEKANIYARTYVEQKAATAGGSFEEVIRIIDDRLNELGAEEQALLDEGQATNSVRIQAIRSEQAGYLVAKILLGEGAHDERLKLEVPPIIPGTAQYIHAARRLDQPDCGR